MQKVMGILDKLRDVHSLSDLHAALTDLTALIEFDYFLLGLVFPNSITQSDVFMCENYPPEWRKRYDEQGYAKRDPIVQYVMTNYMPVTWAQVAESESFTKTDLKIMQEAEEYGLKAGFSLPIHGTVGEFGMISFASSQDTPEQQLKYADAIPVIQMVIPVMQEAVRRIRNEADKSEPAKLTKREIECLTWATEGKSSWEISQILGCSERTAIFHLTNAANKLGAANRYQAISKALLAGIINPLC